MTAVETTKEKWSEAEIHRMAGEIALKSLKPDAAKAEAHFERALKVARAQQAKSWELRVAMSLARLWRDQAHRSLRPACPDLRLVHGRFRHDRLEGGQNLTRRADVVRALRGSVGTMSAPGPSRLVACPHNFARFRNEADIQRAALTEPDL